MGQAGYLDDQICQAPGAMTWHYAPELRIFSVPYPLKFCGSALTDTSDNLSEMCPLKLEDTLAMPTCLSSVMVANLP